MTKTELVLIPSPATGHLVSTIEFAKLIIKHDQRISILVIIFHMPIHSSTNVDAYIESQSHKIDSNRITFLTLPPLSNPPDPASSNFFYDIVDLHKPLIKHSLVSRSTKPAAFVLDLVCVNLIDIAKEFEASSYIYFTSGTSLLNVMFHLQKLLDDKGFNVATEFCNSGDAELDIPGFRNRVPAKVLPLLLFDKGSGRSGLLHHFARRFRETKGILVNTFMELEPSIIQSLHNDIPTIYPVGPVLALDEHIRSGTREEDRDSIIRWLDDQPSSSVVYLCFGSMGSFDEEQVKEIANGLDRCGHRFLWCLRRPSSENKYVLPSEDGTFKDALPPGFLDRTAPRGKIIGWAPQARVLDHRAVGGFLSHCGWNSIVESIWFGVPIGTWPMHSEQQLNAFQLLKELELAVEIRMDYQRNLMEQDANFRVTAEEVENGVKKLMSIDETMRGKLQEMKNISRKVLKYGGSSHNSLTNFISQVSSCDL
ncbi:anthocyanidin 3-O-glucosyltransferase 2 [Beta vulgaris subsp. vulgaris]|uniref:anthocyanidin 3-O-glucosyltransferase 2 n=1 Tax=Beta vulgaris subsp. vulgaris TaxID=3555 RepID=UPI0025486DB0|nr:anthocyanidin 3-O-glucosyltransferase 2 [Beta vulgaris subsp. vulgaris]